MASGVIAANLLQVLLYFYGVWFHASGQLA